MKLKEKTKEGRQKRKEERETLKAWITDYKQWGPESHDIDLIINSQDLIPNTKPIVLDVETDEKDNWVGAAWYVGGNKVYYYTNIHLLKEELHHSHNFIFQGGVFDIEMLQKWGFDVTEDQFIHDTKILAYVDDSTKVNYSLKQGKRKAGEYYPSLVERYLPDIKYPTYNQLVGTGKKKETLDKKPIPLVAAYCSMDAIVTYWNEEKILKRLDEKQFKFYNEIELPTYKLLGKMMKNGVYVDISYLEELHRKLSKERDFLKYELDEALTCNINSPKELLESLRNQDWNLKNTSNYALQKYKNAKVFKDILEYRRVNKLVTTYTEPILRKQKDGILYPAYAQNTDTGRLSSYNPNFQNQPAGSEIRKAFIAPPGYKIISADYSQIETRLFAHLSQDSTLLKIFNEGRDIHQEMADRIGRDRKTGKTLVHGVTYGATEYGLVRNLGMELGEAKQVYNEFWEQIPKAKAWIDQEIYLAKTRGYVYTMMGRKRVFDFEGLACIHPFKFYCENCKKKQHMERQIISTLIQGAASDIIKKAMLKCDKVGYFPRASIHDELLFYIVDDATILNAVTGIRKIMENVVKLSVPLLVDIKVGNNWSEVH